MARPNTLPAPAIPRTFRATAAWLVWSADSSRLVRVEKIGGRLFAVDVPDRIPDRQRVINEAIRDVETEPGR